MCSRPVENRINHCLGRTQHVAETIADPALARWLYGSILGDEQGDWVQTFSIWRSPEPPTRAWFLPLTEIADEKLLGEWSGKRGTAPESLRPMPCSPADREFATRGVEYP